MNSHDSAPEHPRETLTLADLTEAAGISTRTVRYYIAEGLLPPPEGGGPGSTYGAGHLDRLRLIQRMKAAYLPLREIRRRLAGLDDSAVREQLARAEGDDGKQGWDASLAGARDYLALMESGAPYRTAPLPLPYQAPALSRPQPRADTVLEDIAEESAPSSPIAAVRERRLHSAEPERQAPLWHHLPLGDEAELVISDRVYARHRERVDWLVRWARKVFA